MAAGAAGVEAGKERLPASVRALDVLDRYVAALGGRLQLIAYFGDEQIKVG